MHNPGNVEYAPKGTLFTYSWFGSPEREVALGYELTLDGIDLDGIDPVVAVMLDGDGCEVYEIIHASSNREFVSNVAIEGRAVVLDYDGDEPENVAILRRERELYADCFGSV